MDAVSPPSFLVVLRSLLFVLITLLSLYGCFRLIINPEGLKIVIVVAVRLYPFIEDIFDFIYYTFSSSLGNLVQALVYPFKTPTVLGSEGLERVPAKVVDTLHVPTGAEKNQLETRQTLGTTDSPIANSPSSVDSLLSSARATSSQTRSCIKAAASGRNLILIEICSSSSDSDDFDETQYEATSIQDARLSDSDWEAVPVDEHSNDQNCIIKVTQSRPPFTIPPKPEAQLSKHNALSLARLLKVNIAPTPAKAGPYRPFDHLPAEIVSSILTYAVHKAGDFGNINYAKDYTFPATTQLVSQRFKAITLNSPTVWTLVYITERTCFTHLAQRLLYSKNLELDVALGMSHGYTGDDMEDAIHASLQSRAAELIRPHRHRIRDIRCTFRFFEALFLLNQADRGRTNRLKRFRTEPDFLQGLGADNTQNSATFHVPNITLQMLFSMPSTHFVDIRRLCFYMCRMTDREFIDLVNDQPQLEELAVVHCNFDEADRSTFRSTSCVFPSLRRCQIAEHDRQTSGLLLAVLSAPKLEELEITVSDPSPVLGPQGVMLPPKFPQLKRIRASIDGEVFSWLAPSLPSVTAVYLCGYNHEHKEAQVKIMADFTQLCAKAEVLVLEDISPVAFRNVVRGQTGKALRLGIPWKYWGALGTTTREEFEILEDAQIWLRANFSTKLWGSGPFGEAKRFVSWKSMQAGVDVISETIKEWITNKGDVSSIGAWSHVYNPIYDL